MFQQWAAALTIPGLPEWTGIAALVVLLFFGLCLLVMPFSVFGVKGRLDAIEGQLDELRAEVRALAGRLHDGPIRPPPPDEAPPPPIPQAPPAARAEPKISWPRPR